MSMIVLQITGLAGKISQLTIDRKPCFIMIHFSEVFLISFLEYMYLLKNLSRYGGFITQPHNVFMKKHSNILSNLVDG